MGSVMCDKRDKKEEDVFSTLSNLILSNFNDEVVINVYSDMREIY